MQVDIPGSMTPTLSELEGAILSELHHRGRQSAFKVRRSFAISPSLEWRGSAGSVYAAIRRMEAAGLVEGETQPDRRGTRLLRITGSGRVALQAWACDITRAISVGADPFRLRSGIWRAMHPGGGSDLFRALETALERDIETLGNHRRHGDEIETASVELAIQLQRSRLAWLRLVSQLPDHAQGEP